MPGDAADAIDQLTGLRLVLVVRSSDPDELIDRVEAHADDVVGTATDHWDGAHAERLQLVEGFGLGLDVDGDELDAPGGEMLLDPDAVRSTRRPVDTEQFGVHWSCLLGSVVPMQ